MITTLLFSFLVILFFVIFSTENKLINKLIFFIILLLLILVAGLRPKDVDKDYDTYLRYWQNSFNEVEISFVILRVYIKDVLRQPFSVLIFCYSVIGVISKLIGIKKLSSYFYLSCLMYLSHYFLLHELTQIRVGVAAGFFLISLYYLAERNLWKFIIFVAIASFFHYSAFLAFPLWFVYNRKDKMGIFALLVPIGYLIYFLGSDIIVNLPIPYIQDKIKIYKELTEIGINGADKINVYNYVYIVRILVFYVLLNFSDKISPYNKYIYLLLKIYAISLFAFTALASIPSFAFRISELLGVVEIIIFPCLIYVFRNKNMGAFVVVIMSLTFLLFDLFYSKLIL